MALLLAVALLNRARSGDASWPLGMRPQKNAPASVKKQWPARFYELERSLAHACSDFTQDERSRWQIQWVFDRRKRQAQVSSVLVSIAPGVSWRQPAATYRATLAAKIVAADAKPKPPSKRQPQKRPKAAKALKTQKAAVPVAAASAVASEAAAASSLLTHARLCEEIGSGAAQLPVKRQRKMKRFDDEF